MKEREDKEVKHTFLQIWSNNLFLLRLCYHASPSYVILITLDVVRNDISIFLEHTLMIGYILEAAEFHYPFRKVGFLILALAIFILLEMVFSAWVTNYIGAKYLPKVRSEVKMVLYEKAACVDLKCYDDPEYYNQLVLAISEIDKQIERCMVLLQKIFSGIVTLFTTGLYFLYKDGVSIFFVVLALGISFGFNQIYNKLIFKAQIEKSPLERKLEYIKRVFYLPDYAKEIRLNSEVANVLFRDFEYCNAEIIQIEKRYMNKRFWVDFFRRYISNDFISDVIYIGHLVIQASVMRAISYSSVAILYNSFGRLKRGMKIFTDIYPYAGETSLYIQKIRNFLAIEPAVVSKEELEVARGEKKLELKNVCFTYEKILNEKTYVIDNMSLIINPGEKVAIVGYNGAGKTTLMKLIMRLYDPNSGQVFLNDIDIRNYKVQEYRRSIGTVFQDFKIFAGTIKENVIMDAESQEIYEETITRALERSGLKEKIAILPEGINTLVTTELDSRGVNLSGGESQKLAISRVFYKKAGLVILDEPSSALDPIAEYQLYHSMLKMTEQCTVIFISHRLSTIRFADRIIFMENGKIREQGTHEELLAIRGIYAKMWNLQAEPYLKS